MFLSNNAKGEQDENPALENSDRYMRYRIVPTHTVAGRR
jgi:hypothetical protein